jgi:hypothetical protein
MLGLREAFVPVVTPGFRVMLDPRLTADPQVTLDPRVTAEGRVT